MSGYWGVVNTHAKAEDTAAAHLIRQGFEIFLPRHLKVRRHARRRDSVRAPLFPGYMFVWLDPERLGWRSIRSTVGVKSIVQFDEYPAAVPDAVIEEIRARQDEDGLVRISDAAQYKSGDRLRVEQGPLTDVEGIFVTRRGFDRVVILFNLLGREVRASLSPQFVVPCT